MPEPYSIRFSNGASALASDITEPGQLAVALQVCAPPRPVLVLVGGAGSLEADVAQRIGPMFRDELMPLLERIGAAVIDGGTDSGIMALVGQARASSGKDVPLIGVAARGTVRLPEDRAPQHGRGAPLEPNHTHFLLVPGNQWGDESPWISAAAGILAAGAPSLTLAAGGGKVTRLDIDLSLEAGRETLLLVGSGGTTDDLVLALHERRLGMFNIADKQAELLRAVDLSSAGATLDGLLRAKRRL